MDARADAAVVVVDHNEAMYRKLLDVVDLDRTPDEPDDAPSPGASFSESEGSYLQGAPQDGKPVITDPFVLDLFVVFGKPVTAP